VNLSPDDVQDILSLLDSLPYAEMTIETSRFTLRLRRTAEGGWTQETQVTAEPVLADQSGVAAPPAGPPPPGGPPSGGPAQGQPPASPGASPSPGAALSPGSPPSPDGPPSPGGPAPGEPGADLRDIVTPLPGTFYRAPQPGAAPFVDAGGRVEPGTVVAIIETMKLMNPVYAGIAGTVAEICLDDGQFAAQGTVLMRVRAGAG
jgi:acetyl-CoA carboxylase biotin carboxyl carrier protein